MAREQRRPRAESGDERAISAAVPYGRTSQRHETVDQGYNTTRPHLALNRHTPWQRLNNLLGNDNKRTLFSLRRSAGIWNPVRPYVASFNQTMEKEVNKRVNLGSRHVWVRS
jgi:hypothetical protein